MCDTKKELRSNLIKVRDSLDEVIREKAGIAICDKIMSMKEYDEAKSILLYAAYRSEVNVDRLFFDAIKRGKNVYFPKSFIIDGIPTMKFYKVSDLSQMKEGYKGIREPDTDGFDLEEMKGIADICIVPGVAFDKKGYRMGYGKGFYDRYLAKYRAGCVIGVAFKEQIPDELIIDEHDVAMDTVVTG